MDYQALLERIHAELAPRAGAGAGRIADYIPRLAAVPADRLGIALETVGGERYAVGHADEKFSIQSISKVFVLALAMRLSGDAIWARCGREPSGNPFNSLVQLEYESGVPRNPFINAGALVVTDLVLSHLPRDRLDARPDAAHADARTVLLEFVRELAGSEDVDFDLEVAASEGETGHRNAAMAHFLKSFGNLDNPTDRVLDVYFHQCSIEMSCLQLAHACLFLANEGRLPDGSEVVTTSQAKYLNALMLTCGTYDAVGEFAYRVGLPAKSGVGGGIVATLPGHYSLCVWAPGLDAQGNSLLGGEVLERLTTLSGRSIF